MELEYCLNRKDGVRGETGPRTGFLKGAKGGVEGAPSW